MSSLPVPRKQQTPYTVQSLCQYCLEVVTFFASTEETHDCLLKRPAHPTCQLCRELLRRIFVGIENAGDSYITLAVFRWRGQDCDGACLYCLGECRIVSETNDTTTIRIALWSNAGEEFSTQYSSWEGH
jgi:hypothetical protein